MAAVERTGTPFLGETVPSGAGPTSSRESAYSSRVAPTTHASTHPKALTAAPMVMSSPTHPATNWLPRSPSSEPDADKVLDSLGVRAEAHHLDGRDEDEVQAAEDGDAEYRARYVAARLLRLLAQRGRGLEARRRRGTRTPPRGTPPTCLCLLGTENTEKSRPLPFGAVPVASFIRMITLTMRMSATVVPSMTSSTLVPPLMLEAASAHTPASAIAPTTNGAQPG